jgi:hypothetical protein
MAIKSERLYKTPEELGNALVEAVGRRDKEKVSAIGLYALTTQDAYPLDGLDGFDHTDFIWQVASRRLEQLQDPKYDGYYDVSPSEETAASTAQPEVRTLDRS